MIASQLYEIVTLVNELLPPMPQLIVPLNGVTISRNASRKGTSSKTDEEIHVSSREKLLQDRPDLLAQFGTDLFPVLIQVHREFVLYFLG